MPSTPTRKWLYERALDPREPISQRRLALFAAGQSADMQEFAAVYDRLEEPALKEQAIVVRQPWWTGRGTQAGRHPRRRNRSEAARQSPLLAGATRRVAVPLRLRPQRAEVAAAVSRSSSQDPFEAPCRRLLVQCGARSTAMRLPNPTLAQKMPLPTGPWAGVRVRPSSHPSREQRAEGAGQHDRVQVPLPGNVPDSGSPCCHRDPDRPRSARH